MTDVHVIELERDVANPEAKACRAGWDYRRVIPMGTRFIVRPHREVVMDILWPSTQGTPGYRTILRESRLGRAISANARRVPPVTVGELQAVYRCRKTPAEILTALVKLGRVDCEDFAAVAATQEGF